MDKILMISLLTLGFAGTAGAVSLTAPETSETSSCPCESETSTAGVVPAAIPVVDAFKGGRLSRGLVAAGAVPAAIPVDKVIAGIYADDVANVFKGRSRSGGGCGGSTSVKAYEDVVAALADGRKYHKFMRTLHGIRDGVEAGVVKIKSLYNIMSLRPSAL